MSARKAYDETTRISRKRGNGILRREIWVDDQGRVTRYNLAYINHAIFPGDNGRVIGYDNAHGVHHRHVRGKQEPLPWTSFEEIEDAFQRDWLAIHQAQPK
jgi:hypothetical protein